MFNHSKKNKIINSANTLLILALFILITGLAMPVQAKEVCCEIQQKNSDFCNGSVDYELAADSCTELPNLPSPDCIISITETSIDKCKGQTQTPVEPSAPLIITPQVSIPGTDFVSQTGITIPASGKVLADYIVAIFKYSAGIIGVIAAIVLMYAGIRWLTAGGNQNSVAEAKKYITGSLSGLILTLCAFLLLSTINTDLVALKIPNITYIKNVPLESLSDEEYEANTETSYPMVEREKVSLENMQLSIYKKPSFLDGYTKQIYSFLNIQEALAQSYSPPGHDGVPLIRQCGQELTYQNYSRQGDVECSCTENKERDNSVCKTPKNGKPYSTICSSGCGIISLQMVVSSYYDSFGGKSTTSPEATMYIANYMQDKPGEYRKCNDGTKKVGLVAFANHIGMTAETINIDKADQLLEEGYPIMASVNAKSPCTDGAHWIVLTGKSSDGQYYTVNNPSKGHAKECGNSVLISGLKAGLQTLLFIHPK